MHHHRKARALSSCSCTRPRCCEPSLAARSIPMEAISPEKRPPDVALERAHNDSSIVVCGSRRNSSCCGDRGNQGRISTILVLVLSGLAGAYAESRFAVKISRSHPQNPPFLIGFWPGYTGTSRGVARLLLRCCGTDLVVRCPRHFFRRPCSKGEPDNGPFAPYPNEKQGVTASTGHSLLDVDFRLPIMKRLLAATCHLSCASKAGEIAECRSI